MSVERNPGACRFCRFHRVVTTKNGRLMFKVCADCGSLVMTFKPVDVPSWNEVAKIMATGDVESIKLCAAANRYLSADAGKILMEELHRVPTMQELDASFRKRVQESLDALPHRQRVSFWQTWKPALECAGVLSEFAFTTILLIASSLLLMHVVRALKAMNA